MEIFRLNLENMKKPEAQGTFPVTCDKIHFPE